MLGIVFVLQIYKRLNKNLSVDKKTLKFGKMINFSGMCSLYNITFPISIGKNEFFTITMRK